MRNENLVIKKKLRLQIRVLDNYLTILLTNKVVNVTKKLTKKSKNKNMKVKYKVAVATFFKMNFFTLIFRRFDKSDLI